MLANARFRLLFAGRTLSLAGSGMAPIALAFAVYGATRSPAALGLVLGARMLPVVVFSLVGGVWADRVPRQRLLVASDLLSASTQAATGALVLAGHARIWELIVLQAGSGAATAIFQPAVGGAVAEIVPEEERTRANALLGITASTTRIGGTALGGVVVALIGAGYGLVFDAATFLGSALLLSRLGLAGSAIVRRSMLRELREGWSEFASRPWVWAISTQFAVLNAIGIGSFLVLGPLVAKQSYDGPVSWGLITTALAAGLVAGGFVALRVRMRRALLAAPLGGLALVGVLALLAARSTLFVVMALVFAHGMVIAVMETAFMTKLQNTIPADRLSRVLAYELVASMAFIPLGAPAVGAVAAAVGTSTTLWAAAVVVALASAIPLFVAEIRGSGAQSTHLPAVRPT